MMSTHHSGPIMFQTRRSLARALLLGALPSSLGTVLRPGAAAAQGLQPASVPLPAPVPVTGAGPAPGLDLRAPLSRARLAMPAANTRGRAAVDRSLERLADLGVDAPQGRLIVVNIAAAEVIAYNGGREVLRSRAVVGASKTRTPQLATFVTSARCNPPWYVPASIEPEIRAAGAVGFRVVNGRLIQPPGPTNPLGQIRIGLLDSDGIFLHGTSSPGLFARSDRALSHGCVRVERIRDLAAWMLDQTPSSVAATIASGRTIELLPNQEVQVAIGYLTAWPDANGRVLLHADPYGLDVPGVHRAAYRRVSRPLPQPPAEAEAAARLATPEDNPL
jgi:lipoprotein-anchoring transpeptidase ErfK/SrfK